LGHGGVCDGDEAQGMIGTLLKRLGNFQRLGPTEQDEALKDVFSPRRYGIRLMEIPDS